jgi:hypothetical protein
MIYCATTIEGCKQQHLKNNRQLFYAFTVDILTPEQSQFENDLIYNLIYLGVQFNQIERQLRERRGKRPF